MPYLKNCYRSPAVVFNNAACPQWHGTENDIIHNSVPKPGILQSLQILAFIFRFGSLHFSWDRVKKKALVYWLSLSARFSD